jgi:AraC-like DNA-binding protein
MKNHLDQPLRAATLASVAKMSLPHYFVIFKRCTGSTPIDYFIKLRMERARELLTTTSCSVKEIAGVLGYDDPLYFSRVFKSVNQTTPTQYRADHKVHTSNGSMRPLNGLSVNRLQASA